MEPYICNYSLYRTTPKLSGNMQLDLIVSCTDNGNDLIVKDFHIRPISDQIPFNVNTDEYLLNTTHQNNIVRFHNRIRGGFYTSPTDPGLASDWPDILPEGLEDDDRWFQKNWDDTYWAGTKRAKYQLYNKPFECLVPVWLESAQSLDIAISVGLGQSDVVKTRTLHIARPELDSTRTGEEPDDFHRKFCGYFIDYLEYTGIYSTNQKCINIDFERQSTVVHGLSVTQGIITFHNDLNLIPNICGRERPLLEQNVAITNLFHDYNLICPQLINFNIIFDPTEWVKDLYGYVTETPNFKVMTDVYINDVTLPKADIYTNHFYIPRPIHQTSSDKAPGADTYTIVHPLNVLDHLNDWNITDIMHANKMVQPICHWRLRNTNDDVCDAQLFNNYDGFGAATLSGLTMDHVFGDGDSGNSHFDPNTDNASWAGIRLVGDGNQIRDVLEHPEQYIQSGHLRSLSGGIGGNIFGYKKKAEEDPDDIYICLCTTPTNIESWDLDNGGMQQVSDPAAITMWMNRWQMPASAGAQAVDSLPENKNNIPRTGTGSNATTQANDVKYDIAKYHDMDGRYTYFINFMMNASDVDSLNHIGDMYSPQFRIDQPLRLNDSSLSLSMKHIDYQGKDVLIIVAWQKYIIKEPSPSTSDTILARSLYPDGLTLQGFRQAVSEYVRYYKETLMNAAMKMVADFGGDPSEVLQYSSREFIDGMKGVAAMFRPGASDSMIDALDNLSDLELVAGAMGTANLGTKVIYSRNGVLPVRDPRLSTTTTEQVYIKDKENNSWVHRLVGNIYPAIFRDPYNPATGAGHITWHPGFGRNYLWLKDRFKISELGDQDKGYKLFVGSEIAPKYPSVGYDPVRRIEVPEFIGDVQVKNSNIYGDLDYHVPPYHVYGKRDDGSAVPGKVTADLYWPDFKWFDESVVYCAPPSFETELCVVDNTKKALDKAMVEYIRQNVRPRNLYWLGNERWTIQPAYIRKIYQHRYRLDHIECLDCLMPEMKDGTVVDIKKEITDNLLALGWTQVDIDAELRTTGRKTFMLNTGVTTIFNEYNPEDVDASGDLKKYVNSSNKLILYIYKVTSELK